MATDLSGEVWEAYKAFRKFLTVKNVVVTIIVIMALTVVCSTNPPENDSCNEDYCPMRLP